MAEQLPLDLSPKIKGQRKALENLDPAYVTFFWSRLATLILNRRTFTVEDITAEIGYPSTGRNGVGALMSAAASSGRIKKIGYKTATRKEAHGRIIHLWAGANYAP